METEKEFLERFSLENIIRRATQPPDVLQLPSEYAQQRPDTLGMQTDDLLASMSSFPGSGQPQSAAPQMVVPLKLENTPKGAVPVVGRDIGLDQITDWVRKKESSGNYTALNKEKPGNTASGAYQYTDATWNGYGGYAKAMFAPPAVQDRRFAEDIQARFRKFNGDPFKMIAAHYLPAAANDPSKWSEPYKLRNGQTVKPIAEYVAYVVKGTPLEKYLPQYLAQQAR